MTLVTRSLKKHIFIGTLPGMAEETKREQACLTLHAADLMPVEAPWQDLSSPLILLETPAADGGLLTV